MMLTSYIFKPKHGIEFASKAIEAFCNEHLNYGVEGFHVYWRGNHNSERLPDGYVEFWVETEDGNMTAFTEISYNEEGLDARDLTDNYFALLDHFPWYYDGNEPIYTFYERELSEVVAALGAENSRVLSFDGTSIAWVQEIGRTRTAKYIRFDMLEHIMSVPIPDNSNRQLTLPLA